jgi:hypothetical protein
MATRSVAGVKSLAILGYGIWRWRLMAQGNQETSGMFSAFLGSAVTWLTSRDAGKLVRVRPSKDAFARGERIEFSGQVYDANGRPVDNAQVRLEFTSSEQTGDADLRPTGNGRYEGSIGGLPQEDYAYRARAMTDGTFLGQDTGAFSVGGLNLEFLDTRMDSRLLGQLALATGGKYYKAGLTDGLKEALDSVKTLVPREEREIHATELQHWPYALVVILLLLAAEWIIRKRSGML